MSDSTQFSITNNILTVQEGGFYEFHFKDFYKRGAAALKIQLSDTKGTRIKNIVTNLIDTNGEWIDINVFQIVRLLPGHLSNFWLDTNTGGVIYRFSQA